MKDFVNPYELIGERLDYAVSLSTNPDWSSDDRWMNTIGYVDSGEIDDVQYSPSTDWSIGGPIIEREKIELVPSVDGKVWYAESLDRQARVERCPTPLIAAMRCFVASKLGDEVEIPEKLT
jgi:hypothetical protein